MNSDGGIELRLGGAEFDRDADDLNEFASTVANDMATENAIRFRVDNELHCYASRS